jgi:hypothetical protein
MIVIIGCTVIFMLLGGIVVLMANMLGIIMVITCWSRSRQRQFRSTAMPAKD